MECILCSNNKLEIFNNNSYFKLPVYFCPNCILHITGDSITSKEKVGNLYSKKYWDNRKAEDSIKSNYTDNDSLSKIRSCKSQFKYCRRFIEDKKSFLEIGCGGGQSLKWFEENNFNVTGLEPDPNNVKLINSLLEKGKCLVGYIEDTNFKEKFDIIWMSHVLEHLISPKIFLENIKNVMDKNSVFFIEVPNAENKNTLETSIFLNPHIFHFSKKSLIKLAELSGYDVISSDYFRPARKIEGLINKLNKIIKNRDFYEYYPRIKTNNANGIDLRIIIKLSNFD